MDTYGDAPERKVRVAFWYSRMHKADTISSLGGIVLSQQTQEACHHSEDNCAPFRTMKEKETDFRSALFHSLGFARRKTPKMLSLRKKGTMLNAITVGESESIPLKHEVKFLNRVSSKKSFTTSAQSIYNHKPVRYDLHNRNIPVRVVLVTVLGRRNKDDVLQRTHIA